MSPSILEVDNIERTRVHFFTHEDTNTTSVSTLRHHRHISDIEFDDINNLVLLYVELDSVVKVDFRIRVADGAAIVGDNVRDGTCLALLTRVTANHRLGTLGFLHNLEELEFRVSGVDLLKDKTTLDVIQEAELLVRLGDGDDIHESSRVIRVSADLVVDFNEAAHDNDGYFATSESVLKTVTQDETERKAFTKFVRSRTWTRSPFTTKLVEHPVLWSSEPLKVLLRSARHGEKSTRCLLFTLSS